MILFAALLHGGAPDALDAELWAAASATAVLQRRCTVPVRADVNRSAQRPAPADVRARLGAGEGVPVAYRLVRLMCGALVYSRAENWYRPDRLTARMNKELLASDAPFGAVIRPLAPHRLTLSRERPEAGGVILRYRALVLAGDGTPLAEVVESYLSEAAGAPVLR